MKRMCLGIYIFFLLGIHPQKVCKEIQFTRHIKHKDKDDFFLFEKIETCFNQFIMNNIALDFHFHTRPLSSYCSRCFFCSNSMSPVLNLICREICINKILLVSCLTFCLKNCPFFLKCQY